MSHIARTLFPLIWLTSSTVCFSVVETSNNVFVKQPNYHVTEIGNGGSSSLRTRHINLNNNKNANKPIIKTDFHIVPYVTTSLADSDLIFDPVTSQFVSRKIPKRTYPNHTGNKKKLTDYYKTIVYQPKIKANKQKSSKGMSNTLSTNKIKFKYRDVQPHSFSQKISFSPIIYPSTDAIKPEANYYRNVISQKPYKDNKAYEPNLFLNDFLSTRPTVITKTKSNNGELKSDHEIPKFIPVKPIYPGEGKWALRGKKYKPYDSKQIYSELQDATEHPEAEAIFQGPATHKSQPPTIYGEGRYNNNYKNIQHPSLKRSEVSAQKTVKPPENIHNVEKAEEASEEQEQEFIPTRTLAQVRQYENEEHNLPPIEPRLREIIKDSKTHTVFTEEGYEDMAYDHANHEKNAEKGEESEELHEVQDILKEKSPKQSPEINKEVLHSESQHTSQIMNPESRNSSSKVMTEVLNNTESSLNNKTLHTTDTSPITEKFKKEHGFRIRRNSNDDVVSVKNSKLDEIENSTYDSQKYPYYNQLNVFSLNNNSPLRYAENFKNRPKKKVGKMSFYEDAQRRKCREIEDLQPIPKQIKDRADGKDHETPEDPPKSNAPKLNKLGDAIECFKEQLFGESPLDNPLFSEKSIAEPTPIFQDLQSLGIFSFSNTKEINTFKNKRNRRHLIDPAALKNNDNELNILEKLPLHGRRKSVKRRIKSRRKNPRTPFPGSNIQQKQHSTEPSPTVLPKYKTISEVQYKDDIKPNEQLNVFTDIIKNIKLSSENIHDTNAKTSDKIKITTFTAPKKNKQNISFQTVFEDEGDSISDSSDINTFVTYQKPKSDFHRRKQLLDENPFFKDRQTTSNELFHKSPTVTTVRTNNFILGLKPPPPLTFASPFQSTSTLNRKYYTNKDPSRRWNHRLLKRSAAMPTYSQIRRKTTVETTTETDEYIPRRNRNYHYDEKTGKIIYYTTQASLIEEIEPVITEEQYTSPKRITTESAVKITTEMQKLKGPSFLEFVSKLKSHEGYVSIPDPKPVKIEKGTSETTTTEKPASTTEPEFLKILKMVKSNPDYKEIGKKNVTTTTSIYEEEQDYTEGEEVLQSQNVPTKNSPGSSLMTHIENNPNNTSLEIGTLKIFDINEYIPRPRNYSFVSFVNTSKYSTIKRNPVGTNKEDEDSIKSEDSRTEIENNKLRTVKSESNKTEETTRSTVEHINEASNGDKLPSMRVHEKLVKEEPKSNSRRLRSKIRNQRINRNEGQDKIFRHEPTSENPSEEKPKRSVRRYRVRPRFSNETKINGEVERQSTKEIQNYGNIRNRRSWNSSEGTHFENYEKRISRRRREEPRYVTESETVDLISDSATTIVPETTAPTIRSRGRTRHRTSYRTTPTPRYRRGRKTKPIIAATTAYHAETVTTPYSAASKRRRRPIPRMSSSSAPPLQIIPAENGSNTSNQNEEASTETSSTPLTLESVELESKQNENNTNTGDFSHVSARKVQDVEVFKDYDKTQKHGGNYRGINDQDVIIQNPDEVEEAKQSMQKDKVTEGPLVLDFYPADKEAQEDRYQNREERRKGHNQRDGSNQLQNYDKEINRSTFDKQENLKDQIKSYEVVENREIQDNFKEEPVINDATDGYTDKEEGNIQSTRPREEYLNERTESRRVGPQIPANQFFGQEEILTEIETTTATAAFFHSTSSPSNVDEKNDKLVVQVFDLPNAQEIPISTAKTIELDTLETASYFSGDEIKQQSHQQQLSPHQHQQKQQKQHQQHHHHHQRRRQHLHHNHHQQQQQQQPQQQQHQPQPQQQQQQQQPPSQHQPSQQQHQQYDRNESNETYYNSNFTPTKAADEIEMSSISPDYVLNSGGIKFTAKESASLKLNNDEALPKKAVVDFTDPPTIHRTVKKRIRIKPNNFDFTTITPDHEEYKNHKGSVLVEDNVGRQESIKEETNHPRNVEIEPTLHQFENVNDTILNQNTEASTNLYNNNQFDRVPVKHHQQNNRSDYNKQEVFSTSTITTPIYLDSKYVTTMPDIQQQEEIEAPPETFYQGNKGEQLPFYSPRKEQLPKDPYNYRRIEEEGPNVPVNIQHNNHRPVKKFKNSPERINGIVSSTEKFFFIKDPSKRNYFYAPI